MIDENNVRAFIEKSKALFEEIVKCQNGRLGHGAQASVYKYTTNDGQTIAIKSFLSDEGEKMNKIAFYKEMSSFLKLDHINVIKCLGCQIKEKEKDCFHESKYQIALEYC